MSDTRRFDKEILSAWVDGQASSAGELNREESLEHGSESMSVWSRYHVIGQVMREEAQHMDLDISARVSQAIADEDSYVSSQQRSISPNKESRGNVIPFPNRVWKQAGGFAIAASVAVVALFSVSNTQPGMLTDGDKLSTAVANSSDLQAVESGNAHSIVSNVDRNELQAIHGMFLKHETLTKKMTGMSSLPTVTVVSNQKVIPVQIPMRIQEQETEMAPQQNSTQFFDEQNVQDLEREGSNPEQR